MRQDGVIFLSSLKNARMKVYIFHIVLDVIISIVLALMFAEPILIIAVPVIIWITIFVHKIRKTTWEYLSNRLMNTDFEYKLVGNSLIELGYPSPNVYETDAIDFLRRVAGDDSVAPGARMDALCRIAIDRYLSAYCRLLDSYNYQKMTQKAVSYLYNHHRQPNTPMRDEWS